MTSVTIYKNLNNQWVLSLIVNPNTKDQFSRKKVFSTLVAAMDAANTLRMHITNENVLPLRQYVRTG